MYKSEKKDHSNLKAQTPKKLCFYQRFQKGHTEIDLHNTHTHPISKRKQQ